jgi:hypothetical protein
MTLLNTIYLTMLGLQHTADVDVVEIVLMLSNTLTDTHAKYRFCFESVASLIPFAAEVISRRASAITRMPACPRVRKGKR